MSERSPIADGSGSETTSADLRHVGKNVYRATRIINNAGVVRIRLEKIGSGIPLANQPSDQPIY